MGFYKTISEFREKLSRLQEGGLSVADVDTFYKNINNLDFRFSMFSEYYQKYIENLNRFKPNTEEENPDVTFLLIAIKEDRWKPIHPMDVFLYHVRYKYKLTSKFFISRQKRQNRKKLDASGELEKQKSKFDPSKKWTRIPTRQNQCKPGCGCSS